MQTRAWMLLSVVWICSVIGGFAILNRYATLPAHRIAPPRQFPHSAASSFQASSDQIFAIPATTMAKTPLSKPCLAQNATRHSLLQHPPSDVP